MKRFRDIDGWREDLTDEQLADLIDLDGRALFAAGAPVTLGRYLEAEPGLERRPVPLDAAIEATLRSMSGASVIRREDAETLASDYPRLRGAIMDAYILSRVIATTNTTREVLAPTRRDLPCEFGPLIDGDLARFRLKRLLGEGSFGQVFLADDRLLSDDEHVDEVAIKIAWAGASDDSTAGGAMRAEATRARRTKHPNVARLHDRGTTPEGEAYLVFEYVEGGTLNDWIDQHEQPIDPQQVARMMGMVCQGVHAAHRNGVIHHDLKPANVLIDHEGQAKVTDFGISITAGAGADADRPRGNLAFAAPEQVVGDLGDVSTVTDIYSLGAMMFWLLTGDLPHGGRKETIERWHRREPGERTSSLRAALRAIDRDLAAICMRAMALAPDDRYPSAAMMGEDLDAWRRGESIGWTRPAPARRAWKGPRRKPVLAGTLAAGVLAAALAGVMANRAAVAATELRSFREGQQSYRDKLIAVQEQRKANEIEMQALTFLWLLESMDGHSFFGDPMEGGFIWSERRRVAHRALEETPPGTLMSLFWQTQLSVWLIEKEEPEDESVALVASAIATASAMLRPDDPFLEDLDLLRLIADVKHARNAGEWDGDPVVIATLDDHVDRLGRDQPEAALHLLAKKWRELAGARVVAAD